MQQQVPTKQQKQQPVVIRKNQLPISTKPLKPLKSNVTPREGHSYLCLTRSTKEQNNRIIIGDIEIELVSIRGRQARIGIYAPKDIRIERAERFTKIT